MGAAGKRMYVNRRLTLEARYLDQACPASYFSTRELQPPAPKPGVMYRKTIHSYAADRGRPKLGKHGERFIYVSLPALSCLKDDPHYSMGKEEPEFRVNRYYTATGRLRIR
jgi:hypothetical protein